MPPPTPKILGVHLVGSVPLSTTEEVLRTVSQARPHYLRRIPDGETGERKDFARWQESYIGQWPIVFNRMMRKMNNLSPIDPLPVTEDEKHQVLAEMGERLETRYDVFALESYEVFQKLRGEGVISKGVRFMVGLPSPVTVTALMVRREFMVGFEEVYERAMMRALGRIQEGIPSGELSIQWDCPLEMGMLDRADLPGWDIEPWWEGEGVLEGIVRRLARLCDSVKEDVEVGVHLCYGDTRGKHFIQPKDSGSMVAVASGTLAHVKREVDFIHMPVPKDRTDDQYFEALHGLLPYVQQGRELCLGLIHSGDLEGTRERIHAAAKVIPAFSVSSECGFGRGSPEKAQDVLEIASIVAQSVTSE